MSNTATAHRRAPVPTAARPLPARPSSATAPGTSAAGRYRYDLGADRWWWSPEAFAVLGQAPAPTPPAADLLLRAVHRPDRPRVRQAVADACRTGTPFALELRVQHADGRMRTVVLVGEPETTADAPGVTALSGMLIDVTDGRLADPDAPEEQVRVLETEVEQLRQAMASRAAIEQAKGILMLLMGCGDQVAFDLLAHISSHTHRKVRDVAGAIIDSASGGHPLPTDVRAILHDACPPGSPRV
jgi:ANTAR domain-containing protein/PAS domain-containing protein